LMRIDVWVATPLWRTRASVLYTAKRDRERRLRLLLGHQPPSEGLCLRS
jgi:hypothetical protein